MEMEDKNVIIVKQLQQKKPSFFSFVFVLPNENFRVSGNIIDDKDKNNDNDFRSNAFCVVFGLLLIADLVSGHKK